MKTAANEFICIRCIYEGPIKCIQLFFCQQSGLEWIGQLNEGRLAAFKELENGHFMHMQCLLSRKPPTAPKVDIAHLSASRQVAIQ
jgi:hypothetical protein